jgi:hypothetical protein
MTWLYFDGRKAVNSFSIEGQRFSVSRCFEGRVDFFGETAELYSLQILHQSPKKHQN